MFNFKRHGCDGAGDRDAKGCERLLLCLCASDGDRYDGSDGGGDGE